MQSEMASESVTQQADAIQHARAMNRDDWNFNLAMNLSSFENKK